MAHDENDDIKKMVDGLEKVLRSLSSNLDKAVDLHHATIESALFDLVSGGSCIEHIIRRFRPDGAVEIIDPIRKQGVRVSSVYDNTSLSFSKESFKL